MDLPTDGFGGERLAAPVDRRRPGRPTLTIAASSLTFTSVADDSFEQNLRVRLLRSVNRLYCRVFHHVIVTGHQKLPRTGPGIIVANHISSLDPLLVQSAVARPIVWMMAREYYEIKAMRWIFESVRAIPVDRNGKDTIALRQAMRALQDGHLLGLFPEGQISVNGDVLPFQTGVGLIARRSKAPIFPVYQFGSHAKKGMVDIFLRPQLCRLHFGEPLAGISNNGSGQDLDAIAQQARDAVQNARNALAYGRTSGAF